MKIVVCAKQVPENASDSRLEPDTFVLDRSGKQILDESDTYGVEMALKLRDELSEGEVVLFSMAPNQEMSGLRQALAMGADRAILVSDEALAGSDSLVTAKVLAKCVEREGDVTLVVLATESTDGYSGVIGGQTSELLGWPCMTFASHVEVSAETLTIHRQCEGGYDEVQSGLPAVVSVTAGVVEPRYPTFKGIMEAKKKPVEVLSISDLGLPTPDVGFTGARQSVVGTKEAALREAGEKIEDDGSAFERIVAFLDEIQV